MIADREGTHFWHAPRRKLLLDTIDEYQLRPGSQVLDVGSGTGTMVKALGRRGFQASGLDPWALGLEDSRFVSGRVEAIPWPNDTFDAACAFDVLEHAEDVAALRELFRVVAPGGALFVTVPAHSFLWSARDAAAGHCRRYSASTLRRRVEEAGFVVERVFGYQILLLPLLMAMRIWARLRGRDETTIEDDPHPWINLALRGVNEAEVALCRWHRPPTGSSIVLVAHKPGRVAR